jgi:hypothetical protein
MLFVADVVIAVWVERPELRRKVLERFIRRSVVEGAVGVRR